MDQLSAALLSFDADPEIGCMVVTGSEKAFAAGADIAAMAPLAALACKEMVNAAFETTLQQGVVFERRLFHGLFGTEDQKEGMAAFVEKRPGNWTGK